MAVRWSPGATLRSFRAGPAHENAKQGPSLGSFSRFQPLQRAFPHPCPFRQFGLGQIQINAELHQSPAHFLQKSSIMIQFLKLHGGD